MTFLLQLIIFGIFILIGIQIWNALKGPQRVEAASPPPGVDHEGSPAQQAAQTLNAFEEARAALKSRYPAVFAMLGGYLNSFTLNEKGSLEAAVKEMIADWKPRADEAARELTRLLAENETEAEARAIVLAACDADFEQEGYRAWLIWLLGQFNEFGR